MTPEVAGRYFKDPEDMTDDELWDELQSLEDHGFVHGVRWQSVCREMDKRGL